MNLDEAKAAIRADRFCPRDATDAQVQQWAKWLMALDDANPAAAMPLTFEELARVEATAGFQWGREPPEILSLIARAVAELRTVRQAASDGPDTWMRLYDELQRRSW